MSQQGWGNGNQNRAAGPPGQPLAQGAKAPEARDVGHPGPGWQHAPAPQGAQPKMPGQPQAAGGWGSGATPGHPGAAGPQAMPGHPGAGAHAGPGHPQAAGGWASGATPGQPGAQAGGGPGQPMGAPGAAGWPGSAGPSHGRAIAGAAASSAFGASGIAGNFLFAYLKGEPVEKPRLKGALGAAIGVLLLSLNCVLLFLADRYYPAALAIGLPFLFGGGALAGLGQPLGSDGRPAMWGKLAVGAAAGFGLIVGIVLAILLRI